jgi:hypothetical protein
LQCWTAFKLGLKPLRYFFYVTNDELAALLWESVYKIQLSPGGCWLWKGGKTGAGYGKLRDIYTHRLSYTLTYGPIPEGMLIRHRCDNPPCCNPSHLELGTKKENGLDAYKRGLQPRKKSTKLTPEKAKEIRALYAQGVSQGKIARIFEVDQTLISRVIHSKRWKD